jgi:hypothetical protein
VASVDAPYLSESIGVIEHRVHRIYCFSGFVLLGVIVSGLVWTSVQVCAGCPV